MASAILAHTYPFPTNRWDSRMLLNQIGFYVRFFLYPGHSCNTTRVFIYLLILCVAVGLCVCVYMYLSNLPIYGPPIYSFIVLPTPS